MMRPGYCGFVVGLEESSDGVALPSARRVPLYEVRQRLYETAAQHGCPATVTQRSSDQHQPRPATTPIALQPYRWACWHSPHTFGQHESAKGARVVYAKDLRRMLLDLLHCDLFRGPGGLGVPCGSFEVIADMVRANRTTKPKPSVHGARH
jgi:hypothetical protein